MTHGGPRLDDGRRAGVLTALVGLGFAAVDAATRPEPGSPRPTTVARLRRAGLVAAPFLAGGHVLFWRGVLPRRH
ncbi:hypothetical protein SAMN05216199_3520 [Pedococcus cremeus]|uniref:Uncharacterized protein n=1 Tax=Pedococcus cremeus TaxID=587636 RepID=A0A1H9X9U5_9MICO|nr:hypothetical protein [Pedococcus cremeus]SES42647.1 hypothetical protein SAMN05216199_3520 [Pedococcus cremeus]